MSHCHANFTFRSPFTLPTLLLGFHLPGFAPTPVVLLSLLVWGFFSQILFQGFLRGLMNCVLALDQLPCSFFTSPPCASPHPIPRLLRHPPGLCSTNIVWNVPRSLFTFRNSLKTYLFLRLTLRMFGKKIKQNKRIENISHCNSFKWGKGPHCSSVFNWLHG